MSAPAIAAIVALAATGAGTGLQMDAAASEQQKMEDATKAELARQKGYQKQGQDQFAASLAKSTAEGAKKTIDTTAADRVASQNATVGQMQSQAPSSPIPVGSAAEQAGTQAQIQQSAQARAKLGGYSDWELQQWIKDLRAKQNLGLISQFARGSAGVLPYELQEASRSAAGEKALGQGVSTTGMLAGLLGGGLGAAASGAGAGTSAAQPSVYQMGGTTAGKAFTPTYSGYDFWSNPNNARIY